ncbi:MAG TPA: zinc-ribbon and DUF3426 domain-containing protein [Methylomirabilota bacterium]|nr:zinc-ribbon and DUF3426 domain-containing protein [Methylomirabilota bacterium]
MYTQCPHCNTAIRVTAPLLQQGAGRVECNGCGVTFNALEKLTEDAPESTSRGSRAMLESLDELTGPHEVRIEDTGVEWRVIDEDDIGEDDPSADAGGADAGATGSVRWYIDDDLAEELEAVNDAATSADASEALADEPQPAPAMVEADAQKPLPLATVADGGDVQRYDDNTPLPEDFGIQAEQEPPRRRAEDRIEPRSPEADEAQVDLALGEPDEWKELLGEVGTAAIEDVAQTAAGQHAGEDDAMVAADFPADIDTQFDLQAIELGIDLTGSRHELQLAEDTGNRLELAPESGDGVWASGADGELLLTLETSEQDLATDGLPQFTDDDTDEDADGIAGPDAVAAETSRQQAGDDEAERLRELAFEQELARAFEITLDDEPPPAAEQAATPSGRESPGRDEQYVPPQTDEEMTINLLIDQDLIRLASEQDVFASTHSRGRREDAAHVETIIMEGEFVRHALEAELLEEQQREGERRTEPARPAEPGKGASQKAARDPARVGENELFRDTYVKTRDPVQGGHSDADAHPYRMAAGIALLGLVLAAQVVHAYRESLATWPAFDRTLAPVYRLLGEPVRPDWNIREWQFEATSGQADEAGEVLAISSRVANRSARDMPYPLLHVSLTDRFEEIIGSTMVEPREYLESAADAAGRVPAGGKFSATVRLALPSQDATGFKLNVCYAEAAGRVRCATEAFRD